MRDADNAAELHLGGSFPARRGGYFYSEQAADRKWFRLLFHHKNGRTTVYRDFLFEEPGSFLATRMARTMNLRLANVCLLDVKSDPLFAGIIVDELGT